jgi:hypothetical protein
MGKVINKTKIVSKSIFYKYERAENMISTFVSGVNS